MELEAGFLEAGAKKDKVRDDLKAAAEEQKQREDELRLQAEQDAVDHATDVEPSSAANWHARATLYYARGLKVWPAHLRHDAVAAAAAAVTAPS